MTYDKTTDAYIIRRPKEGWKPGQRVASTICGLYQGLPGRILHRSQVQTHASGDFEVRLDMSGEIIRLPGDQMELLDDQDDQEDQDD